MTADTADSIISRPVELNAATQLDKCASESTSEDDKRALGHLADDISILSYRTDSHTLTTRGARQHFKSTRKYGRESPFFSILSFCR